MADSKISALTEATSLAATDEFVIATGGATKRVTAATLLATGWVPAGETWTYGTADDPTYTFTVSGDKTGKYSAGMRVRVSQTTGGTKYFIITKVAYGAPNTTVTVYGGTDYNLENETVSSPCYSMLKAPHGFPLNPAVWTVEATDTTDRTQTSPVTNTWYSPGSISISVPIGVWILGYRITGQVYLAAAGTVAFELGLSTASDSESDADYRTVWATYENLAPFYKATGCIEKPLALTAKTSYYPIIRSSADSATNIAFRNDNGKMILRAVCAYL